MGKKKEKGPSSKVHCEVEEILFTKVKEELKDETLVKNEKVEIDEKDNKWIEPDFYSAETKRIGEIHAHYGKIKGAQWNKITKDILKMLLFEKKQKKKYKKYIVVCSKEEAEQLKGDSYVAMAIKEFRINLMYMEIDESLQKKLLEEQKRQDLSKK